MIARLFLFLLLLLPAAAKADEFKPAYLQLTERSGATYDVLWKVPAIDENTPLSIKPVLPRGTRVVSPAKGEFFNSTSTVRYRIAVPGGLAGKPIGFEGLARTRIEILVRFARLDGSEQIVRPSQLAPSFTASATPARGEVVVSYTRLGIEHILGGFDHLLFVTALVMLIRGRRKLIMAITAFTPARGGERFFRGGSAPCHRRLCLI